MVRARVALLVLALLALAGQAVPKAQLEVFTVSLTPGAVNFALTPGSASNPGSTTLVAQTNWALASLRSPLRMYGYFSSAPSALAHTAPAGTIDIPSARIEVSVNGAAAQPFDQSAPFGAPGAGRQLFTQTLTLFGGLIGSRTDNLTFNINLAGYTLPAGEYTGTLRLRASIGP